MASTTLLLPFSQCQSPHHHQHPLYHLLSEVLSCSLLVYSKFLEVPSVEAINEFHVLLYKLLSFLCRHSRTSVGTMARYEALVDAMYEKNNYYE